MNEIQFLGEKSHKKVFFSTQPLISCSEAVLLFLSTAQYLSFLTEPSSLVQGPGSTVRLKCLVSPSSAAVSWRLQGLPLDQNLLPGVELRRGSLIISSLTASHAGVYQCVARLDHGPAIVSRLARVAVAGTDADNHPSMCMQLTTKSVEERKTGSGLEKWKC